LHKIQLISFVAKLMSVSHSVDPHQRTRIRIFGRELAAFWLASIVAMGAFHVFAEEKPDYLRTLVYEDGVAFSASWDDNSATIVLSISGDLYAGVTERFSRWLVANVAHELAPLRDHKLYSDEDKFDASHVLTLLCCLGRDQKLFDKVEVWLNSRGGHPDEGLRLALFFRDHSFATRLKKNAECWSACAIAFMGGHDGDAIPWPRRDRVMHQTADLAFHRPFVLYSIGDLRKKATRLARCNPLLPDCKARHDVYLTALIQEAYDRGVIRASDLLQRAAALALRPAFIRPMMATGGGEFFRIKTLGRAVLADIPVRLDGPESRPTLTQLKAGNHLLLRRACAHAVMRDHVFAAQGYRGVEPEELFELFVNDPTPDAVWMRKAPDEKVFVFQRISFGDVKCQIEVQLGVSDDVPVLSVRVSQTEIDAKGGKERASTEVPPAQVSSEEIPPWAFLSASTPLGHDPRPEAAE
jgi:hypothetical protein